MGKTVRSWQKRSGWQVTRRAKKKRHLEERKDRFRYDPNKEYKE